MLFQWIVVSIIKVFINYEKKAELPVIVLLCPINLGTILLPATVLVLAYAFVAGLPRHVLALLQLKGERKRRNRSCNSNGT